LPDRDALQTGGKGAPQWNLVKTRKKMRQSPILKKEKKVKGVSAPEKASRMKRRAKHPGIRFKKGKREKKISPLS